MAQKSYQQLQDQLDEVLGRLQSGDTSVDEALELYKQGRKLISQLEEQLEQAENEVKKLTA